MEFKVYGLSTVGAVLLLSGAWLFFTNPFFAISSAPASTPCLPSPCGYGGSTTTTGPYSGPVLSLSPLPGILALIGLLAIAFGIYFESTRGAVIAVAFTSVSTAFSYFLSSGWAVASTSFYLLILMASAGFGVIAAVLTAFIYE